MLETRYANALSVYDISRYTGVTPVRPDDERAQFYYRPRPGVQLVWPISSIGTSELLTQTDPSDPKPPYVETGSSRLSVLNAVFIVDKDKSNLTVLYPPGNPNQQIERISGVRLGGMIAEPFSGPADMFKNDYDIALRAAAVWMSKTRAQVQSLAKTG